MPQDIGGKAKVSYYGEMPAFVDDHVKLTRIFCSPLRLVITFTLRSRFVAFKELENPDVRTTDDPFPNGKLNIMITSKEFEIVDKILERVEITTTEK